MDLPEAEAHHWSALRAALGRSVVRRRRAAPRRASVPPRFEIYLLGRVRLLQHQLPRIIL